MESATSLIASPRSSEERHVDRQPDDERGQVRECRAEVASRRRMTHLPAATEGEREKPEPGDDGCGGVAPGSGVESDEREARRDERCSEANGLLPGLGLATDSGRHEDAGAL